MENETTSTPPTSRWRKILGGPLEIGIAFIVLGFLAASIAPSLMSSGKRAHVVTEMDLLHDALSKQEKNHATRGLNQTAPASPMDREYDPSAIQTMDDAIPPSPPPPPAEAEAAWDAIEGIPQAEAPSFTEQLQALRNLPQAEFRQRAPGKDMAAKTKKRDQAANEPVSLGEADGFMVEKPAVALSGRRENTASTMHQAATLWEFRQRDKTTGLPFQEAAGQWGNNYVPGDPLLRHLQARLRRYHTRAYPLPARIWQPFDAPRDAALAVYLHADKTAVRGSTRLLVQVGLQGTLRRSGRRPAMNVGLVLDLRETPGDAESAAIRALLQGFARARRTSDRFSLTLAGRPGGTVLRAEDFRHGPLQVQLAGLFGDGEPAAAQRMDLQQAVQQAQQSVRSHDNPNALLGSSVVILITARPLGTALGPLENFAYRSAVDGIPFSVVAVGNQVRHAELERVALMGQGNRRLLLEPDDAAGIVDKELHAVSHTVARAVRVNIRLAPGVKLVEVLDSERLDREAGQRARHAEQSLDQRLARNLGIKRDRGRDDEGIQIHIPVYHAGDSHPILLDVVAEQPGLIAEATIRYKDLVHLRNGTARAALFLEQREVPAGPLEYNVMKNLLALKLAQAARQAGEQLARNQVAAAVGLLQNYQLFMQQIRQSVAGWQHDPELEQDDQLLDTWLAALRASPQGEARTQLADALQYAGFVKLLPEPAESQ